ncbi:MAG TPA: CPBP family intramembrane glutamic endopeptidase [Polyangiaceae bacterium]|nr:CPBP family intramembrane glutamic endopeptidase [Polyangiaceae bacterium]
MGIETETRAARGVAPPLASLGHTVALVGVMLAVAVSGTLLQASAPAAASGARGSSTVGRIAGQYLPLLLVNGLLVLYVTRLFRTRNVLPQLLGRRWSSPRDVLTDLLYASLTYLLIVTLEALTQALFAGRNAAVSTLLPGTEAERLTWLFVAVTVGFCEEVVYRGYLQTQLSAFTRSTLLGVVLQSLLFGLAHLEQGVGSALRIGGYGLLLGALARHRGSLLPGMVCHISIDLASGLLR